MGIFFEYIYMLLKNFGYILSPFWEILKFKFSFNNPCICKRLHHEKYPGLACKNNMDVF